MLMTTVVWSIVSPRRLLVALLLVALEETPDVANEWFSEARYALWRRWPWRTRLVERIPGVPEVVRSVLAVEGSRRGDRRPLA